MRKATCVGVSATGWRGGGGCPARVARDVLVARTRHAPCGTHARRCGRNPQQPPHPERCEKGCTVSYEKSYLYVRADEPPQKRRILDACRRVAEGFQSPKLRFVDVELDEGDGVFEYDGSACALAPVLMVLLAMDDMADASFRRDQACPTCGLGSHCAASDMSLLDGCSGWIYSLALESAGTAPVFDALLN